MLRHLKQAILASCFNEADPYRFVWYGLNLKCFFVTNLARTDPQYRGSRLGLSENLEACTLKSLLFCADVILDSGFG
jgi:hypothetical protein